MASAMTSVAGTSGQSSRKRKHDKNSSALETGQMFASSKKTKTTDSQGSTGNHKFCSVCHVYVATTNANSWAQHRHGKHHKKKTVSQKVDGRKKAQLTFAEPKLTKNLTILQEAVCEFFATQENDEPIQMMLEQLMLKMELGQEKTNQLVAIQQQLQSILSEAFPGCRLLQFGSNVSGLSISNSDLDLSLFLAKDGFDDSKEADQSLTVLESVFKMLKSCQEFGSLVFIRKARVPIIQMVHIETGKSCDISYCNFLAVNNSEWIRSLTEVHANVRVLLFFIKIWASCADLIGSQTGNLSSYALNLLAVFYLQQQNLLPTVESLQSDIPVKICKTFNISFKEPQKSGAAWPPLLELISGFFSFLQTIDADCVISPFDGKLQSITDFASGNPEFRMKIVNIQDPFEKNNNKTFSFKNITKLKYCCVESRLICDVIAEHGVTRERLKSLFLLPAHELSKRVGIEEEYGAAVTETLRCGHWVRYCGTTIGKAVNGDIGHVINLDCQSLDLLNVEVHWHREAVRFYGWVSYCDVEILDEVHHRCTTMPHQDERPADDIKVLT